MMIYQWIQSVRSGRRAALTLFALLALSACGQVTQGAPPAAQTAATARLSSDLAAPAAIPVLAIVVKDNRLTLPATAPAGLVGFTLENQGTAPHQATISRLRDSVTREQFQNSLRKGVATALPLLDLVGGPNTIPPGQSTSVTLGLKHAGRYIALDLARAPDGGTYAQRGVMKYFTVTAPRGAQPEPPADNGMVALREFSLSLPNIHAGRARWKVWNGGTQTHEVALARLAAGKTPDDLIAYLKHPQGQAPFTYAGGMAGLAPLDSAWVGVNLAPGTYVAYSAYVDPTTGKRAYLLGMLSAFTVG